METIHCSLCGNAQGEILFIGKDEWYHQPGDFPVNRCPQCGLIYLSPRPSKDEIDQYYPSEYEPYLPAIADEPSRFRKREREYGMSKIVRAVQKRVKGVGTALDVGCATGNFLVALQAEGWQVHGVDTSETAVTYARDRFDLDVYQGELMQAAYSDDYFDLITVWNVLEHVYDPDQLLQELRRIIRPGGQLLFSIPNPTSAEAHLFGRYWAGWDVPRHLYIFSQDTIKQYLQKTGWELTEIFCMTGRMWLFNLSLQHWLQNKVQNKRWQQAVLAITKSIPVRLLMLPYFAIVERLNKGSIMVIVATPKQTEPEG